MVYTLVRGEVQGRFILFSLLVWELVIADVREDEDTQSEVEFGVGSRARTQDRAQPNISGSGVEVKVVTVAMEEKSFKADPKQSRCKSKG